MVVSREKLFGAHVDALWEVNVGVLIFLSLRRPITRLHCMFAPRLGAQGIQGYGTRSTGLELVTQRASHADGTPMPTRFETLMTVAREQLRGGRGHAV